MASLGYILRVHSDNPSLALVEQMDLPWRSPRGYWGKLFEVQNYLIYTWILSALLIVLTIQGNTKFFVILYETHSVCNFKSCFARGFKAKTDLSNTFPA